MSLATTMRIRSLTARIVCVVALILALAGALIGAALYRSIKRSVREEVRSQLAQRIAMLFGLVDLDEGKLELEAKVPRAAMPQNWRVTTLDGRELWSATGPGVETWRDADASFITLSRTIHLGIPDGAALSTSDILLSQPESAAQFASYSTGEKRGSLTLRISAREPAAHSAEELRRVALALWTIGPASILILVLILALFIRWQHAPLSGMSIQAAAIGPENTSATIGPAGSSVELTRLRDAINSMISRMAAGIERERQFSAMAAHELRTPLTQLRMNVEITLSKERVAAEYREALLQSLTDIDRLQQLVSNLLFLTRVHHGPEMRREVALARVVDAAAKSCGTSPVIAAGLRELSVSGNEELIQCAVRNVLENANRYAAGEPPAVSATVREDSIEMRVTDCGPGIAAADRERIFEPLTRLDEARTIGGANDGFGLGLTVARNAIRACGGELACSARADGQRGAEFVFQFKRWNDEHKKEEAASSPPLR